MERAEAARLKLISEYPEASVSVMQPDLSSLSSIEAFCEELIRFTNSEIEKAKAGRF